MRLAKSRITTLISVLLFIRVDTLVIQCCDVNIGGLVASLKIILLILIRSIRLFFLSFTIIVILVLKNSDLLIFVGASKGYLVVVCVNLILIVLFILRPSTWREDL